MIFGLNLPNYSSLGHRDAITAIAAIEQYGRVRHFRVSMRTGIRTGSNWLLNLPPRIWMTSSSS